ncbi:MAG: ribonuclease J [Candidatus Sericytochromatia bacterium]|nr:ribonuclease J [Candidatus Sericytochromatia bacterium]
MAETELKNKTLSSDDLKGLQIIPLGGLGEIGKNMMAIRYLDDIIVVDVGLGFPSEEHYGVDYILPNTDYLIKNQHLIRGIILTHGHEDHIGGINDFLRRFTKDLPPVYGTRLTLGLVEDKLSYKKLYSNVSLRVVQPRQRIQLGVFKVEFLKVCHSIADSVGLAIETPLGNIIHTGDFKFDPTPVDGELTDYYKFAEFGEKGVLLLMSDSTNVTRPGFTPSEKEVAPALINAIGTATNRVIVTTFASNIHRVQQIINISTKFNRKIALVGRSMERVTKKAIDMGYIKCKDAVFIKQTDIEHYKDNEITIITTGSQGEPMSVLTRIAKGEHKIVVSPGDTIIISAVPIPGNEKMVFNTINKLFSKGAEVIYEANRHLHVSGHASSEELKMMINLTKPKYFVPIHGESRHLIHHGELAQSLDIKKENIFIMDNGDVLEITPEKAEVVMKVPANKVLIDGSGIGFVEDDILRDRQVLSRDGVIFASVTITHDFKVASDPQLVSKGFIIQHDDQVFYKKGGQYLKDRLEKTLQEKSEIDIDQKICDIVSDYAFSATKRRPLIIPVTHLLD